MRGRIVRAHTWIQLKLKGYARSVKPLLLKTQVGLVSEMFPVARSRRAVWTEPEFLRLQRSDSSPAIWMDLRRASYNY